MKFHPSYYLAGASPLPLDVGYLFLLGSNILLGCSAPSCNFGVLPGENEGTSFYSGILYGKLWSESHNTEWGFPRDILVPGNTETRGRKG